MDRGLLLLLAACGRIGFDPAGDGRTGDGGVDAAIPSGLFAWYPLDDDFETTVARDISGNVRHATCASCPVRVAGRTTGFAAGFDGVSTHLEVTDVTQWGLTAFTISAWVSPERRPPTRETIVARPLGNGTDDIVGLHHLNFGGWSYVSQGNGGLATATLLPVNGWTHIAISFDGTKRIYTNGLTEGMVGHPVPTYDTRPFLIGADLDNGTIVEVFQGRIEHVMVFDRALSAAEISSLAMP